MRNLEWLELDKKALAGRPKDKKENAERHLEDVCPYCPSERKALRDVNGTGECWWEYNWRKGNYDIPKNFGFLNWLRQYIFGTSNLDRFRKYAQEEGLALAPEGNTDREIYR